MQALTLGPGVAYAWKDFDETEEQVLKRSYQERPEVERARQVIVFSWLFIARSNRRRPTAAHTALRYNR